MNKEDLDFAAKDISLKLYVSEASLSRFSKKLGFNGYREFIYEYKLYMNSELRKKDNLTLEVLETYRDVFTDFSENIDHEQMLRITDLISKNNKVYIYGVEKAALVARQVRKNFMKLGLNVQDITDRSTIEISEMLVDEDTLSIGFSIAKGDEFDTVMEALVADKAKGATTVMVSSNPNIDRYESFDEFIPVKEKENREINYSISPRLPMFMLGEIIYVHCMNLNSHSEKLIAIERRIK